MARISVFILLLGFLFSGPATTIVLAQEAPAPDGETPAEETAEKPAEKETETALDIALPEPGKYDGAAESHRLWIGHEGRAELFTGDGARLRVRGERTGSRFAYFGSFPDKQGFVILLHSGWMYVQLGVNPLVLSLPTGEAVLEGNGAEATLSFEDGVPTLTRMGGSEGALTVYFDGLAEEVPGGGWVKLTPDGLGESAVEKELPEAVENPSFMETFHYLTGDKGMGEVVLAAGTRFNMGFWADFMLAANRTEVAPKFLAELRNGPFSMGVQEADGILLETPDYRISFSPDFEPAPAEEETGEETDEAGDGSGEGGGEEESSRLPSQGPRGIAGRLVSVAEGEAGLVVKVTPVGTEISNHTGSPIYVFSKTTESLVRKIGLPSEGSIVVQGNTIFNTGPVVVQVWLAGKDEPIELQPNQGIEILEDGTAEEKEYTPEQIRELQDRINKVLAEGGGMETVVPEPTPTTPEPAPTPAGIAGEGDVIPPVETAFKDPGFVKEKEEASPYNP